MLNFDDFWKSVVIGGDNLFHNYFCLVYSCFFFILMSRVPEFFVESARWPRFANEISRALVSYWHALKLVLTTRLHSNTFSSLLYFFYLLETLELH
jgi:hypothetical protein